VIAEPINDNDCLGRLTDYAAAQIGRRDLVAFALQFRSTAALATRIRAMPQRDDEGDPKDGPRVACDVSQRARVPAGDPNCVERALLYLVVAEHIDPRPVRQLITIDTPAGRHTLPVEDGVPIILDPRRGRNEIEAGVWRATRAPRAVDAAPALRDDDRRLLEWIGHIAEEPAERHAGELGRRRVARARHALVALATSIAPLPKLRASRQVKHDLAYALDLADVAAPLWGPKGVAGVAVARAALGGLGLLPPRNALLPHARPLAVEDLDVWNRQPASMPDAAQAAAQQPGEERGTA
jgi:hypothetical protein